MTKKRNTKVGETKETMMTAPKTMKNRTFNTMRLVCHSSAMHPNQVKVHPVVHVHKVRVDWWTGTLQGQMHLVGANESVGGINKDEEGQHLGIFYSFTLMSVGVVVVVFCFCELTW
jgi:hypothetical protein